MAWSGGAVLGSGGSFGGTLQVPNLGPGAVFTGGGYGFGALGGQGGSAPGIIPGMMDVYNQTLGLNENNYQNVLNTYSQGQANLSASLPNIYAGYGAGLSAIKNTLGLGGGGWGVAQPAETQILNTGKQQLQSNVAREINSGLYNETGSLGAENQIAYGTQQATGQLGAQLAQTYAGYQSQFNLADLAAQQQGLGMQTNLTQAEGSTLGNYRFANTAGNLTGQYSVNPAYGGGGGSGGVRGGLGGGGGGYGAGGGGFNDVPSSYYNPTDPWQFGQSESQTAGGYGGGWSTPGATSVAGWSDSGGGGGVGYGDAESG